MYANTQVYFWEGAVLSWGSNWIAITQIAVTCLSSCERQGLYAWKAVGTSSLTQALVLGATTEEGSDAIHIQVFFSIKFHQYAIRLLKGRTCLWRLFSSFGVGGFFVSVEDSGKIHYWKWCLLHFELLIIFFFSWKWALAKLYLLDFSWL